MIFPFLWMLATSVKTIDPELIAIEGGRSGIFPTDGNPLAQLFPKVWHWENYVNVFREIPFARYYLNSLLVGTAVTVGQLLTSSMAAFAFSRLSFPGRDKLFMLYLATLMIPGVVTIIPTFIFFSRIGFFDSLIALMLPPMFSAYGTFMLRQFFLGIPKDLEEAATLDGCGSWRIYWTIILPLSLPALATLGIFTFIANWQSLFYPLVLIHSDERKTLPLGIMSFVDINSANWPHLMAASILSLLPIIIIFLLGQRFFSSGLQVGGVKS